MRKKYIPFVPFIFFVIVCHGYQMIGESFTYYDFLRFLGCTVAFQKYEVYALVETMQTACKQDPADYPFIFETVMEKQRDNVALIDNGLRDLEDAFLMKANLSYQYLAYARLSGADLGHADMQYADLICADLTGVQAEKANFSYAQLRHALLKNGDFKNADFSHADLRGAHLTGSHLEGALFTGALRYDDPFQNELFHAVYG